MRSAGGGLGIALFDSRYLQDPYPLYERMHATGHVHRVGDSGFYALSSWDAVTEALSRCDDFSSNLTATMTLNHDGTVSPFAIGEVGAPTQVLATADDPSHAVHRKAVIRHLAAKRIGAAESFTAETVTHLWNSAARDGRIEWMSAVANTLPMMIVARLIGVPDGDVDRLIAWGYGTTQLLEGLVGDDERAAAGVAVLELGRYITDQLSHAATSSRDDLLGDLATACATGEMDEIAAQVMMITLFSAGGESTASLIGSAAWILATHPDVQRRLRDRPDLLGAFLEEVLRFEPPFRGHYRHVLHDTTLAGVDLTAGSRLLLLWGAANRDPSHFDAPEQFRLDRVADKRHIAFGKGAHFCVGAALARSEATAVLRHLLECTSQIRAVGDARWLPSLLVRRLEHLELEYS